MGVARVDGPMTNAEKCRQYRHRKRHQDGVATVSNGVALVSPGVAPSESPDLTYQVGSVPDSSKTPSSSQPVRFVGTDTASGVATTPKTKSSRRAPADLVPKPEHRAIAAKRGVDFELELSKFRDHEFAKPKTDWDATLRNWMRNARPTMGGNARNESAATAAVARARRITAEAEARGETVPNLFPLLGAR
jgi:transposase-like protein